MGTIYKYPIPLQDEFVLLLPTDARILTIQEQRGQLVLWATVNPTRAGTECRVFRCVGTGHAIPDENQLDYIATVQMADGNLVWHFFEKIVDIEHPDGCGCTNCILGETRPRPARG